MGHGVQPSKCQVVRATTARDMNKTVYILHGQVLEVVTNVKYSGIDISNGLSWNTHIDGITATAAPVWDPYTKQKILQLERVQCRAARWITSNYNYMSSVTAMLDSLG